MATTMMHSTTSTEPSADAMAAAYAKVSAPGWPTLAEITEAARRYQLVRGAAQRLARGEGIERPLDAVQHGPIRVPAPARTLWPWAPRRTFDFKRAAANDLDENT